MVQSILRTINKHHFATQLHINRKHYGLTKIDVATIIGVSRNTYSAWENPDSDKLPKDLNKLYALSQVLGLRLHFVITGALETQKDKRYTKRISELHERQAKEPKFNALTKLIQDMPSDKIEALINIIEYAAPTSTSTSTSTRARKTISRVKT